MQKIFIWAKSNLESCQKSVHYDTYVLTSVQFRRKWKTKYLVFHEWVMNYWNGLCHISEVVRLSFKKVISSEKLISVNPFILSGSYSRLHFLTDWKISSKSSHRPRRHDGRNFFVGRLFRKTGSKLTRWTILPWGGHP